MIRSKDEKLITSDHWKVFDQLKKDRVYLIKFYEDLLDQLYKILNKNFQFKQSKKYWRIILGPWLIFYLVSMYDKWRIYKNKNKSKFLNKKSTDKSSLLINTDLNDFWRKAKSNDDWVNENYKRIYYYEKFQNLDKFIIKKNSRHIQKKNNFKFVHYFEYIFSIISIVFSKYIINTHNFSKFNLFKLFLYSKILPANHKILFNYDGFQSIEYFNLKKRNLIFNKNQFNKKKDFKNYLYECLKFDFPIIYLERFIYLRSKIEWTFNFRKKKIITMISHVFNEKFKIFLAEMMSRKSKISIIEHGGCLNYQFDSFFSHENKISNQIGTWEKFFKKKFFQLPAIQLLNFKDIKKENPKNILFISHEILKYPMKIQCLPYNSNLNEEIKFIEKLLINLNKKLKSKINFRYSSLMNDKDNFVSNSLNQKFPKINFYNARQNLNFKNDLQRTKLVICLTPETTLAESMISNTPTILYLKKGNYHFSNKSRKILKKMKEANIYFDNPTSLSKHILSIEDNPLKWWRTKKIQSLIDKISKTNFLYEDKWLVKWTNFIKIN